MTPQPQVGDTIDILVKGVRVTHIEPAMPGFGAVVYAAVPKATGNDNSMLIPADSPAITLTVTTPATSTEWPPRLGDLWRDRDGSLWFATTAHRYSHGPGDMPAVAVVELVHTGGGPSRLPDEVNRECGPFTLVRREQPQDVWPPQVGDVWKDRDGDVWTAFCAPDGVRLRMGEDGTPYTVQDLYDTYSPLTFVSRDQP